MRDWVFMESLYVDASSRLASHYGILLLRPELHLFAFFAADASDAGSRIVLQAVVFDGVAEDCGQLIVDDLEVCRGVGLLLLIPIRQQLVLPGDDVFRVDIAETALSEVGEKLRPGDMILCSPSALLQTRTHVLLVQLAEGFEGHVEVSGILLLKGALPFQRFAFGGEAALAFLLPLTLPVLIANHGILAAILFVLIDGHRVAPPSAQRHTGAHTGISG